MMIALCAAIVLFLLTPCAFSAPLGSWPLTPLGSVMLVMATGMIVVNYRSRTSARRLTIALVCVCAVLIAARWGLAASVQQTGWRGAYFANDEWSGRPEWSSDFRLTDATRIDRALHFAAGELPLHFLNSYRFTEGDPRDVSQPLSVDWRGVFQLHGPYEVQAEVEVSGNVSVAIDGRELLATDSATRGRLSLDAGLHEVEARYRKGANVPGALGLTLRDSNGELKIFPPGAQPREQPGLLRAATIVDWAAVLVLGAATFTTLRATWRCPRRWERLGALALMAGLGIQGYLTALQSIHFRTLSGGDDWFGFESRARDILENGLLMPLGRAVGQGEPYFYHPFYSYVLAVIHALTGESLFGAIFLHFLILGLTALLVGGLVKRTFGLMAAAAAVLSLVALFELDFVRYYSTTLLSENLYILTVTCCLVCFARWAQTGRPGLLVSAGVFGGVSAATRPAMMVFFIPAVAVAVAVARKKGTAPAWPIAAAVVASAWLAVVLPFTVRNLIVSRQAVLISSGQQRTVVALNVPPSIDPTPYVAMVESGQSGTAGALLRIAADHPGSFAAFQFYKLGFTLGMVHWFKPYRPHPELLVVTALYLSMLVFSPAMRSAELWPVHAFVASHWASMALTSPWNYGYRLILPPYIYTTALSVGAACAWRFGGLKVGRQA